MKKGLLIILSGPSGVGKGTIRRNLMADERLNLAYSISMTTRAPRNMEKDGIDYYFVDRDCFQHNIDTNNFLEWAEFVGNRYGTPKDKVEELRNLGKNVLLEIEIKGATQVLNQVHDDGVISFFLMPPSLDALEKRIRNRKSESDEVIRERLDKGQKEMTMTNNYDHVILNDVVSEAVTEIKDLLFKKIASQK